MNLMTCTVNAPWNFSFFHTAADPLESWRSDSLIIELDRAIFCLSAQSGQPQHAKSSRDNVIKKRVSLSMQKVPGIM